jgi:hypothetical protein
LFSHFVREPDCWGTDYASTLYRLFQFVGVGEGLCSFNRAKLVGHCDVVGIGVAAFGDRAQIHKGPVRTRQSAGAVSLFSRAGALSESLGVEALEKKFRHKTRRLVREARALGLIIEDQDDALLLLMGDTDVVIEARYIKTGMKTLPALEAFERTSKNIRNRVANSSESAVCRFAFEGARRARKP